MTATPLTPSEIAELERLCEGPTGNLLHNAEIFRVMWKALPRLLAEVKAQGWRTIDSAPEDGPIDLWCDGRRFMDCYWDRICAEYRTTGSAGVLQRLRDATHWMPTPKPPKVIEDA